MVPPLQQPDSAREIQCPGKGWRIDRRCRVDQRSVRQFVGCKSGERFELSLQHGKARFRGIPRVLRTPHNPLSQHLAISAAREDEKCDTAFRRESTKGIALITFEKGGINNDRVTGL